MSFNDQARQWDTPLRMERATYLANEIIKKIPNSHQLKALEIGCGTGLIACELHSKFVQIDCLDPSIEMVNVLQSKITALHINNLHILTTSKQFSETDNQKYDLIYSSMVFHHIQDLESELAQLFKLLKPNGTLIIIDLDEENGRFHEEELDFNGHNGFNRTTFSTHLEQAQFKNIHFETVYSGYKPLKHDAIPYTLFMCTAQR